MYCRIARKFQRWRKEIKYSAIANGTVECLREYLERGGTADLDNPEGFSLLHAAVEANEVEKVKLLIQHGCDVDTPSEGCITPVHTALKEKNNAVLEILLEAKADANTDQYITPLLLAVFTGNFAAVKLILTKGNNCNPNMPYQSSHWKDLPLEYAIMYRNKELCELLLENGASVRRLSDLPFQSMCKDLEILKLFLNYSHELNIPHTFQQAVYVGNQEAAEIILEKLDNPFQPQTLLWLLALEPDSMNERLVKLIVKRYTLATSCSLENKLLQCLLYCCNSEIHISTTRQLKRTEEIMKVLIQYGLVIHSQTIRRFCQSGGQSSACRGCFHVAMWLSDLKYVPSLKVQCCSVIRQNLHNRRGMLDFDTVQSLPLPGKLKDFICMKDW